MTQDEIIELARQAQVHEELCGEHFIYEFAKLVEEQEREKILGVLRRKPDQQIYKVLDEIRSMK